MFGSIARFEFRYQLRNPVFWVAAILFFLLAFGSIASKNVQLGSGGNVFANSPYAIAFAHTFLALFYMFVTIAFVANVVVRDDDTKFGPIVRSTRIAKFDYLFGRFTGAFAAAALAFVSVPLGLWLGSLMPWLDPETLGPGNLSAYLFAYAVIALPVIFLTSAMFFALATATRSMMATYLGLIVFFVLYFTSSSALRGRADLEFFAALLDPFGIRAFQKATEYWTAAERNARLVPLADALLWNRLLWLGVSALFLGVAYFAYRFAERGLSKRGQRRQQRAEAAALASPPVVADRLPDARLDAAATAAQFRSRVALEMKQIFRSPALIVLLVIGVVSTASALWAGGGPYDTPAYPITRDMIQQLGVFGLVPVIVAIYYAGELVWRERERRFHEIIDATPIPNWAYLVPKTIALSGVLVALLLVSVGVAILVQLAKGYTDLEVGKYLLWYLLPQWVAMILLAAFAIFVQALSPSKYIGWGVMVVYTILGIVAVSLGFEHKLYHFGEAPTVQYSDINGAGAFWRGQWWFYLYWTAIAIVLLVAAHLLWRRGTETRFKPRLRQGVARLRGTPGLIAGTGLAIALMTGGWIFYNTNVLNDYRTASDHEAKAAEFEKKFLRYEKLPQPTVSQVKLDVKLFPNEPRAVTRGRFVLRNLTDAPIRDVHLIFRDEDARLVSIGFPGAKLASADTKHGYRIFRLDAPMVPGDTRALSFETHRGQRGFRVAGNDTNLVANGTLLNVGALAPAIGMTRDGLLTDRAKRRENGLPAEPRAAKLEDMSATARNYIGGWVTADITVATDADQTPIAPGKSISDVTANGRRIARFVSDAPILNFFSIQSARYMERRQTYRGVDLAVYHHAGHGWNVDRMLAAMRASLDYFQANFGPYQFDQARIIEFPAYATFAQAFANTMPYSEGFGFAADFRDPDKIDYVTFVTAHEFGHQYWAHQLIGGDMQGATMLSETLAEYSGLMVMKRLRGPDHMRRFLKYELDRYLGERGNEVLEELPLVRVEQRQQYIHYRKGGMVMYLLADRLGEDAVNRALSRLLERFRFKAAPYPRSLDLVAELRKEARSPQDQALITDLVERITVYDLKADEPTATKRPDGRWDVAVPVVASKFYADGSGEDRETPLAEPIDIGLFTAEPGLGSFDARDVIVKERRPIRSGRQVLRFVTTRKPTHAGVDPYNLYIDRNSGDNVRTVS